MDESDQRLIEGMCQSLNAAHDEIVRLQDSNANPALFDWPEWSGPANSIRAAEKRLGRKLAKTDVWTLFPSVRPERPKTAPLGNQDGVGNLDSDPV